MRECVFAFHDPGRLADGDLELVLCKRYEGDESKGLSPAYEFDMIHAKTRRRMGYVGLRVGNSDNIVIYAGHIGYRVDSKYRGHKYAARACKLLLGLARGHGLNPLWITVSPDNIASRRTCEIIGAEYVETVELPKSSDMYAKGERLKCRYRLYL